MSHYAYIQAGEDGEIFNIIDSNELEALLKNPREENEILKKQAQAREAEIESEREQQAVVQEAEIKAVKMDVESTVAIKIKNAINALERYTIPETNAGQPMVDYNSVIKLIDDQL